MIILELFVIISKPFYLDECISMKIDTEVDFHISFDVALSLTTNSQVVITISEIKEPTEVWYLHYTCSRSFISAKVIHCVINIYVWK